jgi:hypothetical protein
MKRTISVLATAVAATLVPAHSAFAAEIKVTDCDGTPRAIREVRDSTNTSVEIRVTDKSGAPLSDVGFVLSSAASESLTSFVVGGKGGFKNVTPGAWKICQETAKAGTTQSEAIVSQVAVITTDEEGSSNAAAWLGGAGVAVTGVGLGVFSGRDSSESAVPSSTGGSTDSGGSDEPSAAPLLPADDESSTKNGSNPSKKPGNDKIACPATEDCLNEERPDPLPPISPST